MRKACLLCSIFLFLVVVQGCIMMNVHPLYRSADDIVFDPWLVGRWSEKDDDKEVWEFSAPKEGNTSYLVTISENNEPREILEGCLVEIDGHQFMDLMPHDFEFNKKDAQTLLINDLLLFPTHTILQIRRSGDNLLMAFVEYEWITDQVEKGTFELPHEVEDDRVLITASSEKLREFVRRYAGDEKVFKLDKFHRL